MPTEAIEMNGHILQTVHQDGQFTPIPHTSPKTHISVSYSVEGQISQEMHV